MWGVFIIRAIHGKSLSGHCVVFFSRRIKSSYSKAEPRESLRREREYLWLSIAHFDHLKKSNDKSPCAIFYQWYMKRKSEPVRATKDEPYELKITMVGSWIESIETRGKSIVCALVWSWAHWCAMNLANSLQAARIHSLHF